MVGYNATHSRKETRRHRRRAIRCLVFERPARSIDQTLVVSGSASGFTGAVACAPTARRHADGTPAAGQQCAAPNPGEFCAVYFNNGDLKFGRDMHCRVTNANCATACYVSNFGPVGKNDAPAAVAQALNYEATGQSSSTGLQATVTM